MLSRTRAFAAAVVLAISTGGLTGCDRDPPLGRTMVLAFGTTIDVSMSDVDNRRALKARKTLVESFEYMHEAWHAWEPGALGRVNELLQTGKPFAIGPAILELIELGQMLESQSQGLFNPAVGQLVALWGFHRDDPENASAPGQTAITRLVDARPSMHDIVIDGVTARGTNPAVQLDFGGIAKGYGLDLAIDELRELGIADAIVNAGGDLKVSGQHGQRAWRVGIRDPHNPGVVGTLDAYDGEAVFSSGDYERQYRDRDQIYHHIIDPRTGYPARGSASATVIHDDGAIADAAATAIFIAGPTMWHEVAAAMGIEYVLLVEENGAIHMNPAMAERVTLTRADQREVVISAPLALHR